MFLEKLVEIIVNAWERIAPYTIVRQWEGGVILRLGRYHRTVEPGLAWKYPLIEESIEVSTALTTLRLPPQSITTKDEQSVIVAAIVKYRIVDPKPYVCDLTDQADALIDVAMGAVLKHVRRTALEDLFTRPPETAIRAELREQAKPFGFVIEAVTFTDLAKAKSLRLVTEHAANLMN